MTLSPVCFANHLSPEGGEDGSQARRPPSSHEVGERAVTEGRRSQKQTAPMAIPEHTRLDSAAFFLSRRGEFRDE